MWMWSLKKRRSLKLKEEEVRIIRSLQWSPGPNSTVLRESVMLILCVNLPKLREAERASGYVCEVALITD